jgi:hypothetical protein
MPSFFPTDFASSTLSVTSSMLTNFSPLLTVVIGVLLAVAATAFLISVLTKH